MGREGRVHSRSAPVARRGARSVIRGFDAEEVVELGDGEEEADLLAGIAEHHRLASLGGHGAGSASARPGPRNRLPGCGVRSMTSRPEPSGICLEQLLRRLADRDTCLQTERLRRGQATFQLLRGPHPSSFGTELSHHQQVRPLVLRPRITPGVLLSGGSTPRRRLRCGCALEKGESGASGTKTMSVGHLQMGPRSSSATACVAVREILLQKRRRGKSGATDLDLRAELEHAVGRQIEEGGGRLGVPAS